DSAWVETRRAADEFRDRRIVLALRSGLAGVVILRRPEFQRSGRLRLLALEDRADQLRCCLRDPILALEGGLIGCDEAGVVAAEWRSRHRESTCQHETEGCCQCPSHVCSFARGPSTRLLLSAPDRATTRSGVQNKTGVTRELRPILDAAERRAGENSLGNGRPPTVFARRCAASISAVSARRRRPWTPSWHCGHSLS